MDRLAQGENSCSVVPDGGDQGIVCIIRFCAYNDAVGGSGGKGETIVGAAPNNISVGRQIDDTGCIGITNVIRNGQHICRARSIGSQNTCIGRVKPVA